jgi:hypothetical protein
MMAPTGDRCVLEGTVFDSWWARRDLNPQPRDYESPALTVELQAHILRNATKTSNLLHDSRAAFQTA